MTINEIITLVFSFIWIIALIVLAIFLSIYSNKLIELRKKYVNSLDEHDKSVITTYQHIKPTIDDFKKKDK